MYCLLELLTVVGVVVILAAILFLVSAAVVIVDEGIRYVLRPSTQPAARAASYSVALPKPWKATISNRIDFVDSALSQRDIGVVATGHRGADGERMSGVAPFIAGTRDALLGRQDEKMFRL